MFVRMLIAAALALVPATAAAQDGYRPGQSVSDTNPSPSKLRCWNGTAFEDCTAGRQEVARLATANTAAAGMAIYGGNYILNQACSTYGTVAFRYRGPDGTTMTTLLTRAGAENAGTLVQLGSGQFVDVVLTGTTGCNVTLSRIP